MRRHAVPESSGDKLVSSLSFNLQGLASTIAHNSDPERLAPGWIERFVYSPKLDSTGRKAALRQMRARIEQFTEEVDDEFETLAAAQMDSESADQDQRRVGVGVYYFEDS